MDNVNNSECAARFADANFPGARTNSAHWFPVAWFHAFLDLPQLIASVLTCCCWERAKVDQ